MDKNTLENNIHDPDRWDMARLDRELEFDVLGELPEVSSVDRSDRIFIFLLPLLALIVIASLPLFLSLTEFKRVTTGINRDFPFISLESPLLRSAVQDINNKRRELDIKDVQIRRYQDRVLDQDNKLRLLQGLMEETMQIKEQNLLAEIETIVEEERSRLVALGHSDEEIALAVNELKADLDSEYTEKMKVFRTREMGVYELRLSSLREERASLKSALSAAVEERQALAESLETDESELLAQLYEENEFIDIVNAGIDADLEILRESEKLENFWLDELSNQYLGLIEAISTNDRIRAEEHIAALENLFSDSISADLPGIQTRNEADREIVRFFSAYLESVDDDEYTAILAESRLLIGQAISHIESGRYQEADIAWRRVATLWPMMDQLISGHLKTRDELLAAEIREYAGYSETSLRSGQYETASSTWNMGLEQIPGPVGPALSNYWKISEQFNSLRLEEREQMALLALAMEKEDSAIRYEQLRDARDATNGEDRTAVDAYRRELNRRIEEQNAEIAYLETLLAETRAEAAITAASVEIEDVAVHWRLYGVITQAFGDTLVIEPLTDQVPPAGSEVRVMRSLGVDRVIYLADGNIIEAGVNRATSRLYSSSEGAEIYGSPEVDDLVYVAAP